MARVEIIALLGSLGLLALVVELVRRRKLGEAYSLLWLLTGIILVILSLWRELLDVMASVVGIFYPPAALFVIGFGFVLLILLQFSVVVSRLSDENRSLIQRLSILDWRLRQLERELGEEPGEPPNTEDSPARR
ncbi:MAG: DUF2304 family protein [Anaerolineae bacterium]|nr:DUF2304 family protein [Anaerolineae bacterium]NIN98112.1 DUF2304 family protein [Anaerolineae bacterium]NIQ82945.1 DUF2304 family protein [Anaerolineae bacterium]